MENNNIASQADEVEALSAIYGDEWCVVDAYRREYCIEVKNEDLNIALTVHITIPEGYPSHAPPQYTISAPWLRGSDRQMMQNALEEIYIENMGESIIYMWVEKIREILTEEAEELKAAVANSPTNASTPPGIGQGDGGAAEDAELEDMGAEYKVEEYQKYIPPEEEDDMCPEIFQGNPVSDRKSTFQGHLARVTDKHQVDLVMSTLLENKKIANATHNIVAYRIQRDGANTIMITGCEDDGETHAGSRVLHLMQVMNAVNVLVVITRWYGGIHLGPDRFKYINNCARELLEEHKLRTDADDKKGSKSKHKKK